jgi:hypothetical protein
MSDAGLNRNILDALGVCRLTAEENLLFYQGYYDATDDGPDRETIGRVMAQKQSFIDAIDAVLSNHEIDCAKLKHLEAANDCLSADLDEIASLGQHLNQEASFQQAVEHCIDISSDAGLEELLHHHLEAADIALKALKTSSLKF